MPTISFNCNQGRAEHPTARCKKTYARNNRLRTSIIPLGMASTPNSNSCLVYNYQWSLGSPTTFAVRSQETRNNGNVMCCFYQDSAHPTLQHMESAVADHLGQTGQWPFHRT